MTLFEVDEAVNKVRAEVDPEAELIIGAITDPEMQGKMRVSIVATALDNQGPQIKPVVSMVHRIHSRNNGQSENSAKPLVMNQMALGSTEGATALDMQNEIEEKSIIENNEIKNDNFVNSQNENISMESANYLQSLEADIPQDEATPNFEVDSIELATPELFSKEDESETPSENNNESETKLFENSNLEKNIEDKEPEMFEKSESEEDFEIPAFLRRQKN